MTGDVGFNYGRKPRFVGAKGENEAAGLARYAGCAN
jgi:hypothetical protein